MKRTKSEEILQKETFRKLVDLIERGTLPQAILIQGPAGCGKGKLAERFAMALLCEGNGPPCHSCRSCDLFARGNNPSYFSVIPEKGEIKVSEIRNLRPELAKKSFFGKRRVILIRGGDRMNKSAANSLLKILEEPPAGVHFIITSRQAGRLPPTIRSRCFILLIPLPGEDEMARFAGYREDDDSAPSGRKALRISEGNLHLFGEIVSGNIPGPEEITSALLGRDYRKITDIASTFKSEEGFRHGLIILKRLLLDLILLSKNEKGCIMNREIAEDGKVKRLTAHPQKLVDLYNTLTALEFVPRQANRAFICESILLSLSDMEAL